MKNSRGAQKHWRW